MKSDSPYKNLLFPFDSYPEERGTLYLAETAGGRLPFDVQRVFWINGVPTGGHRGMHAHRTCWEALVAVKGRFTVKIDDGVHPAEEVTLDSAAEGLLIPPMVWCELYGFSDDAVCLCFASGQYAPEGYINDYTEFKKTIRPE